MFHMVQFSLYIFKMAAIIIFYHVKWCYGHNSITNDSIIMIVVSD